MSYQITLTDEEYAALLAIAAERGQPIETLVHEALAERYSGIIPPGRKQIDPLLASMLRAGHIRELPTGEANTTDDRAKRERLAASAGRPDMRPRARAR